MRYYLDAAPIIYLVEQRQPFATAVRSKLAVSGIVPVTGALARLECRVKPMRDGNQALLQDTAIRHCCRILTITLPGPLSR